jgi:aspartate dehydrogenase
VQKAAIENDVKVYIPSGSIGGLDVMRTVSLMGKTKVKFSTEKSPKPLINTNVYDESLETEKKEVFNGNAKEAIALLPTQVNVAVATSLATVGPENIEVSISSTPNYVGDRHIITIKNEQVDATLDIYSETSEIAGWSVVNTLRNIASPIVF